MGQDQMHLINKIFKNETIRTVWDKEEEKAYSLMEKADKECYPNFTKEDWEYLIKNTNLPEAKLGYKKEMEKYYRED